MTGRKPRENEQQIRNNRRNISTLQEESLPVGTILMYDGSEIADAASRTSEIGGNPGDDIEMPGWFVCNGNSGAPDLIGRFIRGGSASGATGGDDSPAHSHTVNSHSHTVDSHDHDVGDPEVQFSGWGNAEAEDRMTVEEDSYAVPKWIWIGNAGGGASRWNRDTHGDHNTSEHVLKLDNTDTNNSSPGTSSSSPGTDAKSPDNRPAYYSVIFIIKLS